VAGAGDVNGDGIDDFVLGVPNDGTGGTGAGRVSVFFGGSPVDTVEDADRIGRDGHPITADERPVRGVPHADVGVLAADHDLVDATDDPEHIGYNRGRVYVIANSNTPTAVPPSTPVAGLSFVGASPNPAWNEVNLALELDHSVPVRVTVFDLAGHEVARPIADEWLMGRVNRAWRPIGLASGVYYVRAKLGEREQIRKLVWLGDRR
jgi:hypothetical protein